MKWYLRAFRLYAVFSGRDSRKAFWIFYFIDMKIAFMILFVCLFATKTLLLVQYY